MQDYLSLVRLGSMVRTVQDLGAAVQAWGAEMQPALAARGVTSRCRGSPALGPVAFHPSTLAPRAGQPGAERGGRHAAGGTVTLTGVGTATHVQLALDTGSGIPAEHLAQIFEPLYTTKPGGTGLGLYLAQQIVAAHEGQLTVQSVVGQGTP